MPLASDVRTRGSNGLWNIQNVSAETKIAIANPEIRALRKKKMGNRGVYHSGRSLVGTMRNSEPRDDGCSVERITPQMTNGTVIACTTRDSRIQPILSRRIGANSTDNTPVYNITHHDTSKSTEGC